jgi:Tfp pilus assembly protein PilN
MHSELTNLLPSHNRKAFRQEYFIRLATVAVLCLVCVVIAQAAFLLPSYLYERELVVERTADLQRLSASLATAQEQEAQSQRTSLKAKADFLTNLPKTPTASTVLRAVLAVPRPGVTLTGITFGTVGAAAGGRTMQLSGVADTREHLRSYDTSMGALPFVSSADLPISDYAKDSTIPFTITLTGSLMP